MTDFFYLSALSLCQAMVAMALARSCLAPQIVRTESAAPADLTAVIAATAVATPAGAA